MVQLLLLKHFWSLNSRVLTVSGAENSAALADIFPLVLHLRRGFMRFSFFLSGFAFVVAVGVDRNGHW